MDVHRLDGWGRLAGLVVDQGGAAVPMAGRMSHAMGRRWGRVLAEVAVVFVGITASFWVDDWRQQRQDTETFHRILGEIYYDLRIDESLLIGLAANNNRALLVASDLVLRDRPLPDGDELTRQLGLVFLDFTPESTLGGYTRLANTPLAIPVNDVQLSLDNIYGLYIPGQEGMLELIAGIRRLGTEHWWGRGVIPCNDAIEGIDLTEAQVEAMDIRGQIRPAQDAILREGSCIPAPFNAAAAGEAMADESFRKAIRQVITIRRALAGDIVWLRSINARLRGTLEDYLPDISLPIETLGIVGSATPAGWDAAHAIGMKRMATNDWGLELSLADGEVKFAANRAWTMNWGAPQPWVATDVGMSFAEGQVSLDSVFPQGRARFNGLNIPVRAGRYRVSFNTQTGDYRFERISD